MISKTKIARIGFTSIVLTGALLGLNMASISSIFPISSLAQSIVPSVSAADITAHLTWENDRFVLKVLNDGNGFTVRFKIDKDSLPAGQDDLKIKDRNGNILFYNSDGFYYRRYSAAALNILGYNIGDTIIFEYLPAEPLTNTHFTIAANLYDASNTTGGANEIIPAAAIGQISLNSNENGEIHLPEDIPTDPIENNTETQTSTQPNFSHNYGPTAEAKPQGCSAAVPAIPDLFQAQAWTDKAQLFWSPLTNDITSYYISYSLTPGGNEYGVSVSADNKDGVNSFDINALTPNTTYYFNLRGQNDCMPGDWSPTFAVKTGQNGQAVQYFHKYN